MKKLSIIAITLMVGTSMAFASSLAVPWFSDNAQAGNYIPGINDGVTSLITLKSNVTTPLVLEIAYYNAGGDYLGPDAPANTFMIAPLSAMSFRPVATDPGTTAGGQEGGQAVLVPNGPRDTVVGDPPLPDTKKNGSATITWSGGDSDVQGQVAYFQTSKSKQGGSEPITFSYAHLLPPGV